MFRKSDSFRFDPCHSDEPFTVVNVRLLTSSVRGGRRDDARPLSRPFEIHRVELNTAQGVGDVAPINVQVILEVQISSTVDVMPVV